MPAPLSPEIITAWSRRSVRSARYTVSATANLGQKPVRSSEVRAGAAGGSPAGRAGRGHLHICLGFSCGWELLVPLKTGTGEGCGWREVLHSHGGGVPLHFEYVLPKRALGTVTFRGVMERITQECVCVCVGVAGHSGRGWGPSQVGLEAPRGRGQRVTKAGGHARYSWASKP